MSPEILGSGIDTARLFIWPAGVRTGRLDSHWRCDLCVKRDLGKVTSAEYIELAMVEGDHQSSLSIAWDTAAFSWLTWLSIRNYV